MPDDQTSREAELRQTFAIFNEVAIVAQLSRTMFEARLPDGAGVPHFSLVNHLTRVRDGQTPLALARAFQVPKNTMTHTISGAVKHGWVVLKPHPTDGRSKTVWLTEAGRAFRKEAIAALAPDLAEVNAATTPEDRAALLERLTELRVFLDAYRDPKGSSG
ncbi:MarR family winged helix-turn-helix transcriptional regulator [Jannaschia seohaensis]|uniref:DNA-binding MarR family transcriptional regulator n=1 Tax=Jannaschia seohaensis TaxID=475081 RepID=A0A2Y9A2K9_9RHOB|nr:MarR family winged helix-turn-helix transcriptional regulator [Jannaschia seohaensis]PWJ22412.1 DNA-binding MarR family transcriptional regulator [Jannaschia seohaensis]SSA38690.1 DNA-binding transcriptional regulator, MarR family [Jannaschia seohaensis]